MNLILVIFVGWTTLTMESCFGQASTVFYNQLHKSARTEDKGEKKSLSGRRGQLLTLATEEVSLTEADAYRLYRYGCWCGTGSNTGEVVDNIDFCCKVHDFCEYDALKQRTKCGSNRENIDKEFRYNDNKRCTPPSRYPEVSGADRTNCHPLSVAVCTEQRANCSHAVCLCDMEMIRCFKNYKNELNLNLYTGWAQSNTCAFTGNRDLCFENSCYRFTESGQTWTENRNTCRSKEGDLISIETAEEWQFINEEIQKRTVTEWHVGLKKEQGAWKWVNEQSLTINKWQEGQPTGDGNVAVMTKGSSSNTRGLFKNLADQPHKAFICEIPKDNYCNITADVVVLVQDSAKISETTTQRVKSVAQRLLSVLDGDANVDYNFAFAMYADHLNISSFGSKDITATYMNGLFNKSKEERNNGNKNLLKSTLNKIIEKFQSRPSDNKKVLVLFSDGNNVNRRGRIQDTYRLRETEKLLKNTNKIKVAGALLPNTDNNQRIQELKAIVSEPNDAIDDEFSASNLNDIADQLAARVKRLVACKAEYAVEVFTPESFVDSEFKLTVKIKGQGNQETEDNDLTDTTEETQGNLQVIKAKFFDLDVGNVRRICVIPDRKVQGSRGWTLTKVKVKKGDRTVTATFNEDIPTWPSVTYCATARTPDLSSDA